MRVLMLLLPLLVLTACDPSGGSPQWQIASDPLGGVWRINTETGEMDHCTLGGDTQVHCFGAPSPGLVAAAR